MTQDRAFGRAAPDTGSDGSAAPTLTVIIVSYNTRDLTLAALGSLFATTRATWFRCVVLDNASDDGSADAIARAFPEVELIASETNIGFAAANNRVAAAAGTDWLLLLNPDTEVHEGAIDNLLSFAAATPQAGIWGGRTVFPDGSTNAASCWNRITPWSAFCLAVGLRALFPRSRLFNPEGIGGWQRDSVREVDIVSGCFLLIRRELWQELGGFREKYRMYGEEADLCLRAKRRGWRPMITPDAQIMHLVGASSPQAARKVAMVAKARSTLIRDHWSAAFAPAGLALLWLWAALRYLATRPIAFATRDHPTAAKWSDVWARRHDWLAGYPDSRRP